ncbi:hypothetical protein [Streptomyces melanogenes]
MGTEGTHTILDIDRVVASDDPPTQSGTADYGTLRPLALSRVARHFATDRPSVEHYDKLVTADDEEEHQHRPQECRSPRSRARVRRVPARGTVSPCRIAGRAAVS